MKLLVLDNYDSFTYNLVHMLRDLGYGGGMEVFRNDMISAEAAEAYDKILLSPGPGIPAEAGIMPELIRRYAGRKPILGVCLGHQGLGEAAGAELYNLEEVYHGVATQVYVAEEDPLFAGLPRVFQAGRYHSWAIRPDSAPEGLRVLMRDGQGEVMAIRYAGRPVYGVQFHPESVLTEHGARLLQNWAAL